MRTKTLLALAALTAAGVATSMAQVYSVNAVGYVTVTIAAAGGPTSPAFAIIANPLNNANGNKLSEIMKGVPDGTELYFYTPGAGFSHVASYAPDDNNVLNWGADDNTLLNPGEGVFIKNPTTSQVKITFVGEVPQGKGAQALVNPVPSGYSIKASIVPQSGALDSVLGYAPGQGDVVYRYNHTASPPYARSEYNLDDNNQLNWDTVPVPNVGEGFWLWNNGAAKNWTREFSVN